MNRYLEHKEGVAKEGYIAALIIFLLLFLWFWFYVITPIQPKVQGLMINFGQVETGSGNEAPQSSESVKESAPKPVETPEKPVEDPKKSKAPEQAPAPAVQKDVAKVKDAEAPALPTEKKNKAEDKKDKKKDKKALAEDKEQEDQQQPQEEKKPELDTRALFKKRNKKNTNNASSQGTNTPNGDQGNESDSEFSDQQSDIYKPSRNIGMSDDGTIKADLQGRNLLSTPQIKDSSQKEGRIVVKIKVDNTGQVIDAIFTSGGSSTSDATLKALAIKAAKESKFNFDPAAPAVQTGTMTFTFKVR